MHPVAVRSEILDLVAEGVNDCEIARLTGVARTTVRDMRAPRRKARPRCPRCWRTTRRMQFSPGEYAELFGLYLGDGDITRVGRTRRLRITLDSAHPEIVAATGQLLERCFPEQSVGFTIRDDGATSVLWIYSAHLPCLFPQHGAGKKHERAIQLETWQQQLVDAAPWSFLRGLVHSDGCFFINRTGRYRYLSVEFCNRSDELLDVFCRVCDLVGVEFRRYATRVRIYRRGSVAEFAAYVGSKR